MLINTFLDTEDFVHLYYPEDEPAAVQGCGAGARMASKYPPRPPSPEYSQAMEIAPERHEVEYINKKYLKNLSVVFRKFSRNSPLYVSMELESLVGVGDNMTLKMALYEYLAGHYIPTPLNVAYKFCDFLYHEPFFGQMYAKQFPENWTCPFPAGEYHFVNMTIHLENFPYTIPFTYSSMIVRTRADVQGFFTHTNEEVFRWKTFIKITQKMNPKDVKKNKTVKHNINKELALI